MTEKDMQTLFGKYLKDNPPIETEVYELKICKQKSLPFDRVAPHQIKALLEAEEGGLYHKITDQPWGRTSNIRYTAKKPFDAFFAVNVKSYVVIWFYEPRQPKVFYKLRIGDFLELQKTLDRKSIPREVVVERGIPMKI